MAEISIPRAKLRSDVESGKRGRTRLQTDERVLARITDGIYREPASALRELIFNAYDADATSVWITTDAPRFSQIVVADDGDGMTFDVLDHFIHHIGSSAKRTKDGPKLGITDPKRSKFSKQGRKLIGKIGIGLFAVSQLTRHFQIVTKPRGGAYRYVADVRLKMYSEDELAEHDADSKRPFETGDVEIWREPAADKGSHGTEIVLLDLKRYSRELLQSHERWLRRDAAEVAEDEAKWKPPIFHIGSIDPKSPNTVRDDARLPWSASDDAPDEKFRKLYQAILDQVEETTSVPELKKTVDNYLRTLWTLALSVPVDYIEKHPFDLTGSDNVRVFLLSNRDRVAAEELKLKPQQTVRHAAKLSESPDSGTFKVVIDGVQLLRPIRFRDLPVKTKAKQTKPLLFVAKCRPNLSPFPADTLGGRELAFEGYLFWTPTVVPKENNGILLRLGNACGKLFDDTFMEYEVSEQTRLRQITAELFFSDGLDAALNIDRESFNTAHPHYQFVARWLHRALRQLASKSKAIGSELNAADRTKQARAARKKLDVVVDESWSNAPEGGDEPPTEVIFVDDEKSLFAKQQRKEGVLVFPNRVLSDYPQPQRAGAKKVAEQELFEEQLKAVAQVLDGYGLLRQLTYKQQEELLRAIARVFLTRGDS